MSACDRCTGHCCRLFYLPRSPASLLASAAASRARICAGVGGRVDIDMIMIAAMVKEVAAHPQTTAEVAEASGIGKEPAVGWDGLVDGEAVPDGTYTYTFRGQDSWQNAPSPVARSGTVKVDTTPPVLSAVPEPGDPPPWFSPNGDGAADVARLSWLAGEPLSGTAGIYHARTLVRTWPLAGTSGAVAWNGRNRLGALVADGHYWFRIAARDAAGNLGIGFAASGPAIHPGHYYTGRLAGEKNLAMLIRSFGAYRRQGGDWLLILVGDGPERDAQVDRRAFQPSMRWSTCANRTLGDCAGRVSSPAQRVGCT